MGCDIHAHLEYVDSRCSVEYFASLYLGRNYDLFGLMAGVRGGEPLYEPKGLPSDASHGVIEKCTYYVAVNPSETSTSEQEMLLSARSFGGGRFYDSDFHTFSWLSLKEYKNVLKEYTKKHGRPHAPWESVLMFMKLFKRRGYKPRLVFWFDS